MNPTFFHKSPQVQKSVVTKTKAHSDNVLAALKNAHQSAVHQSREQLEGILKEKQKRVAAADLEFEVENTKHAQVLAVRQCFHIAYVCLLNPTFDHAIISIYVYNRIYNLMNIFTPESLPSTARQEQEKQLQSVLEQIQLSRQQYHQSRQRLQSCEQRSEQLELRMRDTQRQHEDVVSKTETMRERYLEIHQQLGTAAQLQQHLVHDRQIITRLHAHNLELQQQLDRRYEQQSHIPVPRDALSLVPDPLPSPEPRSQLRLASATKEDTVPADNRFSSRTPAPPVRHAHQTSRATRTHTNDSKHYMTGDETDEEVLDGVVGDMEKLSRRLNSRLRQLTAREWPMLDSGHFDRSNPASSKMHTRKTQKKKEYTGTSS